METPGLKCSIEIGKLRSILKTSSLDLNSLMAGPSGQCFMGSPKLQPWEDWKLPRKGPL